MSEELSYRIKEYLDTNNLTLIKSFPVLWEGWECDDKWYLCKDQSGKNVLVITHHNDPRIGGVYELEDKLENYRYVIEKTEEILKELEIK